MSEQFPSIFKPHKLRHLKLRNRINFGTHSPNMSLNGELADRHLHYYLERARGGASMICIEPMPVHPVAWNTRAQFSPANESMITRNRRLTDAIHAEGAAIMQQVFHIGVHADTGNSELPAWAPSPRPSLKYNSACHQMSEAEIEETIEAYVKTAVTLKESGFDGIELNGGYDSLIPSFWSPLANRRDDGWGGDFLGRMRFSIEILSQIRSAVGNNFVVGLTMTANDISPGGQRLAERQEIASYLDERGLMDYIAVKTGTYFDWARVMPTFMFEGMVGAADAAGIKSVLKNAKVQAESGIRTVENAEDVLSQGGADMISLVRAQIADPHLANKARKDAPEEIRGCITCNQVCVDRRFRDYWFSCLVNPSVGREQEWGSEEIKPVKNRKTIAIVGAGPAGLEAARVAAARGHKVTIYDSATRIGGQFRLAATQPLRGDVAKLLNGYYSGELARLGVDIQLGTHVEPEFIADMGVDEVIIATGSEPAMTGHQRRVPSMQRLKGVERDNVFSINQVLSERPNLGQRVVVLDDIEGWMPAAGTVAFLAKQGHVVTVVTSSAVVMKSLANTTANGPLRSLWAEHGVEVKTSVTLSSWDDEGAHLTDMIDNQNYTIGADSLVLATPNRPSEFGLKNSFGNSRVHRIGDCVAARTAAVAFFEARKLALSL